MLTFKRKTVTTDANKNRTHSKSFARRSRRGFSLIETSLAVGITVVTLTTALQFWNNYVFRKSLETEAQQVSLLAASAKRHILLDVYTHLARADLSPNGIYELTINDLIDTESYRLTGPDSTVRRRALSIFAWSPTSTSLIVFAQASFPSGQTGRLGAPRHQGNITSIAWVPPYAPTRLEGAGVNYDIQHLQAAGRTFSPGDFVAIEYISIARDASPYLHRAYNPEMPELTRMETDLDLGNNDLLNVGTLTSDEVVVATTITTPEITGRITVLGNLTLEGNLEINGALKAESDVAVSGGMTTGTLTVGQSITAGSLTSQTATVTSLLADEIISEGTIQANEVITPTLLSTDLSTTNGTAARIETQTLLVNGRLTSDQLVTNTLTTGSCTGC